jgi:hypothetical protein
MQSRMSWKLQESSPQNTQSRLSRILQKWFPQDRESRQNLMHRNRFRWGNWNKLHWMPRNKFLQDTQHRQWRLGLKNTCQQHIPGICLHRASMTKTPQGMLGRMSYLHMKKFLLDIANKSN